MSALCHDHLRMPLDERTSLPDAHVHERDPASASSESESPMHPASPATPRSVDYDNSHVAMPSSRWEFEYTLERSWEDKSHQQRARLERYQRFGMTEEAARQPTPEPMREAYCLLIDQQLTSDRTPSPPPISGSASVRRIPTLRSINHSAQEASPATSRSRNRNRNRNRPRCTRAKRNRIRKTKPALFRGVLPKASAHSMETRSQTRKSP